MMVLGRSQLILGISIIHLLMESELLRGKKIRKHQKIIITIWGANKLISGPFLKVSHTSKSLSSTHKEFEVHRVIRLV